MDKLKANQTKKWIISWVLNVSAWLYAGALYLAIRFLGTAEKMDWATNTKTLLGIWAVGSMAMGSLYWASNVIGDMPRFRGRSYGFLRDCSKQYLKDECPADANPQWCFALESRITGTLPQVPDNAPS